MMMVTPDNNPTMMDLFNLVGVWTARHQLTRAEELRLLGMYLAIRLDANAEANKVRQAKPVYEE